MEKQRPSFLIYKDSFEVLQELSDDDLGKVFRMIFEYTIEGVIPDKKDKNYIAFSFIKLHLDRDSKKYSDIIERNKLNGSKGGRPLEDRVYKSLSGKKIPKHSDSHWVYLLKDEESEQVKVGETKNLHNRRQTIKRNSSKLVYIDFFEVDNYNALEIESSFKNHFKDKRVSGDWFILSDSDIKQAIGFLKNHSLIKKPDIDIDSVIDIERDIDITLKKNNTKKKKHSFEESIYHENEELFYQHFEKTKTFKENPSIDKKRLFNSLQFSDSKKYQYIDWIKTAQNWYNNNPKQYQLNVTSILEKDPAYQIMNKGQRIIYENKIKLDLQRNLITKQHDDLPF